MAEIDYPNLWKRGLIQQRVYQKAGWQCEHCGMKFIEGSTLAKEARRRDGRPMVLTVHHIDGNKANCHSNNLVALCQRCHLFVQYRWKPGDILPLKWQVVPDWITRRGLPYRIHPQMKLFERC